jgi:hypothetical protein
MLKLQIPKSKMNGLIDGMRMHLDLAALERGWDLFHKGHVSGVEVLYGTEIHALLRENGVYDAIIDLEDFKKSECTCSSEGWCEHIAATLFALYVPFGRPELLLQQLKQALLLKAKQQQTRTATIRSGKKQELSGPPDESQPPAAWHRYFDQQFHGFSISHQSSFETFYQTVQETLHPLAEGWNETLRLLYRLHVILFVMRKTEQLYLDSKSSYLSSHHEAGCKAVSKQCLEHTLALVPELDAEQLISRYMAYLQETFAMLTEAVLTAKESPLDWLTVYRMIWWRFSGHEDLQRNEINRLQAEAAKPHATPRKQDVLLLCLAHFAVIRGDDLSAIHELKALKQRNPRDFFLYLHMFRQEGRWDRLLRWLRWITPSMQRASQDDFGVFCQYWTEASRHLPNDEEWVAIMEALLPRTYYFYTAYLLKTSRFKHWVDLQISHRISPANLYAMELKAVEEHDPSLLLPLYTQAVERCIVEKNRTSYATAMKLLKKLHGYYKQLGQSDKWDDYIVRLAAKYSRLRAFQQELKKGKWIP